MAGNGTAVAAVFVVLLFFSVLIVSTVGIHAAGWHMASGLQQERRERAEMKELITERIELLKEDESPEWHGRGDAFFQESDVEKDRGYQVTVRDLSSAFNLNWLRKNIITRGGIGHYIIEGKSTDDLQQYRMSRGFGQNTGHYTEYFDPEFLEEYATCYGYWNVNVADEFSLEKIFNMRVNTIGGGGRFRLSLHPEIQAAVMLDTEALREKIREAGGVFEDLWPYIFTEPAINVNFAPEMVLETLLSYEDFGVVDPAGTLSAIQSMKEVGDGISPQMLTELIRLKEPKPEDVEAGREKDRRIFEYLGCTTWFCEVRVLKAGAEGLRGVIAVLPPAEEGEAYDYRLIEMTGPGE